MSYKIPFFFIGELRELCQWKNYENVQNIEQEFGRKNYEEEHTKKSIIERLEECIESSIRSFQEKGDIENLNVLKQEGFDKRIPYYSRIIPFLQNYLFYSTLLRIRQRRSLV